MLLIPSFSLSLCVCIGILFMRALAHSLFSFQLGAISVSFCFWFFTSNLLICHTVFVHRAYCTVHNTALPHDNRIHNFTFDLNWFIIVFALCPGDRPLFVIYYNTVFSRYAHFLIAFHGNFTISMSHGLVWLRRFFIFFRTRRDFFSSFFLHQDILY